jgi:UDP-3-O-[3-hydroxymyristoyl] glucosamine N-acyltransferase
MTDPLFFEPARSFTVGEIAALTGADLANTAYAHTPVDRIASLTEAGEGALVFVDGKRNAHHLAKLNATAVLCTADIADQVPAGIAVLIAKKPQYAFATVGRLLFPTAARPAPLTSETGISDRAYVDPTAKVEAGAIIEAGAVIGAGAEIGSGTLITSNAVVGRHCRIGRDCYIGPNVSVQYALVGNRVTVFGGAQIGQDGFGFVTGPRGPEKMPQIGRVIIQDDVEIGANTTIDRGALSDTVIGEGTKIDNLVQIAHNVRLGRGCVIAGHCGLSGSVTLGDYVMLGGRVGLADHVTIGTGAAVAAASGVMHDIPEGGRWGGMPAQPMKDFFREVTYIRKLVSGSRKSREDGDD